jgi:hypothetical protein
MNKFIFGLFFCATSLFSLTPLQARHVFKKYLEVREIVFRDGHFRIARPGKPLLKLKTLRANNAGIYYVPKDICKKKNMHRDHDNNPDSDIKAIEKRHGGCKNRPRRSERQCTPHGPRGDGWHDRPEAGPNGPRGRWGVKAVEQDGPKGLPETFRHDHYFDAPGANGAAG